MDKNCYRHKDTPAVGYCKQCLRPICERCNSYNNGICPSCTKEKYSTFYDYYKKWGIVLLIGGILLIMLYYDTFLYITGLVGTKKFIWFGILVNAIILLPIIYYIYNYSFKKGIKYLLCGIDDYEVLKRKANNRSVNNLAVGIGVYILLNLISLVAVAILDVCLLIKGMKFIINTKKLKIKLKELESF